MTGQQALWYFDESGFSPSQPVCYSWALPGQRKHIPYEHARGRRVNVLAAYRWGPAPQLVYQVETRTLTGEDVLAFIAGLEPVGGAKTVVLDNATIHRCKRLAADWAALEAAGLERLFLPGYSPELNAIEPLFGVIKRQELVERTYGSTEALAQAVDHAFHCYADRLAASSGQELGQAA